MNCGRTFVWALGLLSISLLTASAQAAPIQLISSMASGEDWSLGSHWSDTLPAAAGNSYFAGTGGGRIVRSTNNAAAATFPGDSLSIDNTGIFRLKAVTNGVITVNDLKLNGGTLHNGNATTVMTVDGNLSV